jgi:hypothetical protein
MINRAIARFQTATHGEITVGVDVAIPTRVRALTLTATNGSARGRLAHEASSTGITYSTGAATPRGSHRSTVKIATTKAAVAPSKRPQALG